MHGEVSSRDIVTALDRPAPRIKVAKLHGDVNAYTNSWDGTVCLWNLQQEYRQKCEQWLLEKE